MIISDLLISKRRLVHTDYMLRAAVNNPAVIIVCANEKQVGQLVKRYYQLIQEQTWYKRLWWRWTKRRSPVFTSIGNAQRATEGMYEPLMFDNLTLIQGFQR